MTASAARIVKHDSLCLATLLLLLALRPLAAAEYVVRDGDTLSSIASRELGAAARWTELAELNGGLRPEELRVGQILHVPDAGTAPPAHVMPPRVEPPTAAIEPAERILARSRAAADTPAGISPVRSMVERLAGLELAPFLLLLLVGAALAWILHAVAIRLAAWLLFLDAEWGACLQLGLAGGASAVLGLLAVFGAAVALGWASPVYAAAQVVAPLGHLGLLAIAAAAVLRPPHRRSALALAILTGVLALLLSAACGAMGLLVLRLAAA